MTLTDDAPRVGDAPDPPRTAAWTGQYIRRVLLSDVAAISLAGVLAVQLRFGSDSAILNHGNSSYYVVAADAGLAWLAFLAFGRGYEMRFLSEGFEEYRRVGSASLRLFGILGFLAFATKTDVARGFVLLFFPLGFAGLVTGRWWLRVLLARARADGRAFHRVVVVGSQLAVSELVAQLGSDRRHGFKVVGACVSGRSTLAQDVDGIRIVGDLTSVRSAVDRLQADTVAVAGSPEFTGAALRGLSYDLEGSGISLLVAPALLNVAGTRISIRPVAGVPLLNVDEPELDGARKLVKTGFDKCFAGLLLLLAGPVLIALMVLIRLTSRGPALFRQTRVGRDGELFHLLKLRTMVVNAEQRLPDLLEHNEADGGVLFKLKNDPRVTPLGRWLRKWSLDELPQLINVLQGSMSTVGPRPPLPTEVEKYEGFARRRLLVKPGMTGLWQVGGRSDLTWDESIRLDLQYVENWSLGLDLVILAKTALAVVRNAGAY